MLDNNEKCWVTIGVWREGLLRCARLNEVVHCRNCAVYQEAGRTVLETPIKTDFYKDERSHIAERAYREHGTKISLITARVGGEWYALRAKFLEKVFDRQYIQKIPRRTDGALLGIIALDGELKVCLSFDLLLNQDRKKKNTRDLTDTKSCFIQLRLDQHEYVLLIDNVGKMIKVPERYCNRVDEIESEDIDKRLENRFIVEGKEYIYLAVQCLASRFQNEFARRS